MRNAILSAVAVLIIWGSGCLSGPLDSESKLPQSESSEITLKNAVLSYEYEINCGITDGAIACLQQEQVPVNLKDLSCRASPNAYATCRYNITWSVTGDAVPESKLTAGGWEPERKLEYKPQSCQIPAMSSCRLSFVFDGRIDFASSATSTVEVTIDTKAVVENLGLSYTEAELEGSTKLQINL